MPGSTFRCQCKLCSEIFFGAARDTPYCSRCAKQIGYRPPRAEKPARPERRPATPAEEPAPVLAAIPTEPTSERAESVNKSADAAAPIHVQAPTSHLDASAGEAQEKREGRGSGRGPGKKPPSSPVTASKVTEPSTPPAAPVAAGGDGKVSDSLRRSVEHAYSYYAEEPNIALREIIDKICLEFGLERRVVHEIVAPVHTSYIRQQSTQLTPQQRKEIGDRYQNMVLSGARPAAGRRKQIARDIGLPTNAVVAVVAQWAWNHHDPRELSREQKFLIEKCYWKQAGIGGGEPVNSGKPLRIADINHKIAAELSFPSFAVARWVDQLHDDPRPMNRIPSLDEEVREAIEAAYRVYLAADKPPAESLHRELAEQFGCTVRQAHKTLLLYRWRERLAHLESSPEEVEMLRQALVSESSPPNSLDDVAAGEEVAEPAEDDISEHAA